MLEPEFDKVVRRHVRRGTLLIHIRVERQNAAVEAALNTGALKSYLQQIKEACAAAGTPEYAAPLLAGVLALPGVGPDSARLGSPPEEEWPVVEKTLEDALRKLDSMRRDEGRVMANELLLHHRHITDQLALVRQQLPRAMADYRQRLLDRVRQAVADASVTVEPEHLIREIAMFADRSDVAEETTRLASHLDQFAEIVRQGEEGAGRKLEFVIQEMGRETNTLGSKAADVTISRHVVEIKAALEKIREMAQNVE
jgi:uncharacterized protein (TIGR00255 family)